MKNKPNNINDAAFDIYNRSNKFIKVFVFILILISGAWITFPDDIKSNILSKIIKEDANEETQTDIDNKSVLNQKAEKIYTSTGNSTINIFENNEPKLIKYKYLKDENYYKRFKAFYKEFKKEDALKYAVEYDKYEYKPEVALINKISERWAKYSELEDHAKKKCKDKQSSFLIKDCIIREIKTSGAYESYKKELKKTSYDKQLEQEELEQLKKEGKVKIIAKYVFALDLPSKKNNGLTAFESIYMNSYRNVSCSETTLECSLVDKGLDHFQVIENIQMYNKGKTPKYMLFKADYLPNIIDSDIFDDIATLKFNQRLLKPEKFGPKLYCKKEIGCVEEKNKNEHEKYDKVIASDYVTQFETFNNYIKRKENAFLGIDKSKEKISVLKYFYYSMQDNLVYYRVHY